MTDPRLLLLDFTPIPGAAATSTLKAAYFGDWGIDALLHVTDLGRGHLGLACGPGFAARPALQEKIAADSLVTTFQPEIVFYRPVADSKPFHRFAMEAIERSLAQGARLAMWIMDDWPERLKASDPQWHAEIESDLRNLFARSAVNFAISEGMRTAFSERYGAPFRVAHNGVDPADWPITPRRTRNRIVIRYAGSLAPDTTKDSVAAAARAVAKLARDGAPVIMEGRTQKHWMAREGKALNALKGVSFRTSAFDAQAYRRWLSGADIILIAYNFDAVTRAYLKYSFANKVPEAMASGAAILAYGPDDLETLACLKRGGTALVVAEPDETVLENAVATLTADKSKREALGAAARSYAFENFDLAAMKATFRSALSAAAAQQRAYSQKPAAIGARSAIEHLAGPPLKRSAYRRVANAIHDRAPGIASALHPLAKFLRSVASEQARK